MGYELDVIMKAFDGHQQRYADLKSENARLKKQYAEAMTALRTLLFVFDRLSSNQRLASVGIECESAGKARALIAKHDKEKEEDNGENLW